jgi:hypothetical protein
LTRTVFVKTEGHDWLDATCTAPKTCSTCFETTGVAKGHTPGEWIIDKDATVTEDGLRHQVCSDCGVTIQEELIHHTGSPGLAYTVNDVDRTCTITGIGTCIDTDIVIPKYLDGYKVTSIGYRAFLN